MTQTKFKITIEIDWSQYSNNKNVTLINSNGDTFTSDSEGFVDFFYNEKPVEELEVPLAGVTDEEIDPLTIENMAKNSLDKIHKHAPLCYNEEDEHIFLCGFSSGYKSKLSVTGSKPLKTAKQVLIEGFDWLTRPLNPFNL